MSRRAIDESLDRAAVQPCRCSPAQEPLSSHENSTEGDQEGGGGCLTPPTPLACFYPFHRLGSSLNPREAWRRKRVVRDLQAPATR